MDLKKEKKPSPIGTPITYFVRLYPPKDPDKCFKCKKKFKVQELIMVERPARYPDVKVKNPGNILESIKFKVSGRLFCEKCYNKYKIPGIRAVICDIIREPGNHAPTNPGPPDNDKHDTEKY